MCDEGLLVGNFPTLVKKFGMKGTTPIFVA